MALDYTVDLMALYNSNIGNDANYQAPGNFDLSVAAAGSIGVASATITGAGTYTAIPTATADTGAATFSTRMKLLAGSTIAAAGTVYAPTNVLTLVGGTKTTTATITVATCKLVSAAIVAGGTGYGVSQTFDVTVDGGTNTVAATVNVTSDGSEVVTIINSVSAAGSYTVLPDLTANPVTGGTGSGLTLDLVFGVNTFTVSQAGVYSALPANPIAVTGGGGTGFTLTGSWGVNSLVVTAAGEYETVAPTITFSAGAAAATAVLSVATETQENTKKLMLMVETLRSLIAECDSAVQMKDLHEVMRKMMAVMKFGSRTTFSASTYAASALDAAMNYIAKNPTHTGAAI